jgi:Triosephosphate isomerase
MTAFTTISILVVALLSVSNAFVSMKQPSFSRRGDLSMDGGRIPLVAGNWKMNTDLGSAVALATELAELTASVDGTKVEIAVCPPFPFLRDVKMVTYFIPSAHIS